MFTNSKKLYPWRLVGLCLLVALFLTNTVSAAQPYKVNNRQVKPLLPPPSYTFEGELLTDVLNMAAAIIQACNCQNQVSRFYYERLATQRHRLTIYLNRITPGAAVAIWEIVPFQGILLSDVLRETAKYLRDVGCDAAVQNVQYERQANSPTDPLVVPLHIVYLVLQSPSPC